MRKYGAALAVVLSLLLSTQAVHAAPNPNITIVNPVSGSTIYSDNLLVSVKIATASAIKVSVTQEYKVVNGENTTVTLEEYQKTDKSELASVAFGTTESFVSTNALSFYTKKVENVKPGVYKITVRTVDAEDKVIFTNSNPVEIKAKEESAGDSAAAESPASGPAQFLKGLLKIIFNN
ncbi:MAG: hypothetical protein FWG53_03195 [Clostridiales bacterium]|nr:hypothetical protein [Clostridiales bacterium]